MKILKELKELIGTETDVFGIDRDVIYILGSPRDNSCYKITDTNDLDSTFGLDYNTQKYTGNLSWCYYNYNDDEDDEMETYLVEARVLDVEKLNTLIEKRRKIYDEAENYDSVSWKLKEIEEEIYEMDCVITNICNN